MLVYRRAPLLRPSPSYFPANSGWITGTLLCRTDETVDGWRGFVLVLTGLTEINLLHFALYICIS